MRKVATSKTTETGFEGEGKTSLLPGFFCIFIVAIVVCLVVLPKETFSTTERRELQGAPTLNRRTVLDGTFEEDTETYLSDHFPFREFWVGLNSYFCLGTGRTLINGVYVCDDDYYMREPVQIERRDFENNMEAIRVLQEKMDTPTAVLAVPETGYIMSRDLPEIHVPYRDEELVAEARQMLGGNVTWIEMLADFEGLSTDRQLYYRTDHHWTTTGAYLGYRLFCGQMGMTPLGPDVFSISEYPGFLGTTYAKVLLWDPTPDTLEIYNYPTDVRIITEDAEDNWRQQIMNSFYDMDALSGYDPYQVFFGGNHGLMRITSQDPAASGRILVVKDSFANCFLPFLAHHYQETVVVDPRYYKTLGDLVETEQFDQVLFLYGLENLVTDQDLGLINF